jgi:hypothetical protein
MLFGWPVRRHVPGAVSEAALEESSARENSNETVNLLSHYQNLSRLKNEQRWAAIYLHNHSLLTEPVSLDSCSVAPRAGMPCFIFVTP